MQFYIATFLHFIVGADTVVDARTSEIQDESLAYANDCWYLLNQKLHYEPKVLQKKYTTALQSKGLVWLKPTLRTKAKQYFKSSFSERYLLANAQLSDWEEWLYMALRCERYIHPYKHLHVIRAFIGPLDLINDAPEEFKPFGNGPWPCLNPFADHYKQKVISKHFLKFGSHMHGYLSGVFSCDCGFEYSRRIGDDEYKYRYVLKRGPIWERKVAELVANPEMSRREVAKLVGIGNVDTYYQKGLPGKPRKKTKPDAQEIDNKIRECRTYIETMRANEPKLTRTMVRKANQKLYRFMMNHDKAWILEKIGTIDRSVYLSRPTKEQHNKRFMSQIKEAYAKIMDTTKPRRISVFYLCSMSNTENVLNKKEDYPGAWSLIESLVESEEDFELRRIKWAVQLLRESHSSITENNIRDMLRFRRPFSQKAKDYMLSIIEN